MTHLILICAKPFLANPSPKPLPSPLEYIKELRGLIGLYLTLIAVIYIIRIGLGYYIIRVGYCITLTYISSSIAKTKKSPSEL